MISETDQRVPRVALTLMLLFFVLSGVSGLIYQSVWSQYLGLVLGHAAYAQSLVLATFMGGMAIGAWWAARLLPQLDNLLRAYGLLEAAIGIFGIAFHGLFLATSDWLFERWLPGAGADYAGLSRYALALALILPQTILLGMTFPVMSAGLIRWQPTTSGRVLGGLYFFNSIGAAGGALLATFVLVPNAGLPGAMVFAGVLNLVIAALVVLLRVPPRRASAEEAAVDVASVRRDGVLRFVLVAAFVTGAASFMYEIGWVRMLSLALGSSLHTFELMLAAFIGGLAVGGLYIRHHLDAISRPLRVFGWVQVLMGLAALATLPLYDHTFDFVSWMLNALSRTDGAYTLYNLTTAAVSIAIMVPAAFFAGMTLPLMTYALLRRGVGERAIGWVYAANTIGAIAGVLLMVHVAMPLLGLKLSMVLAASIDIGLGLLVLRRLDEEFRPGPYLAALTACGLAVALVLVVSPFDPRRLSSGVYRTGRAELAAGSEILYFRDGKTATITLFSSANGEVTISTNGKPDASLTTAADKPASADEPTMAEAALLALAHHPHAARIANIGFGSGKTTHTLASSRRPREIVTIEIEPVMVAAARGFGAIVERAFTDPRSKIVFDDARAYFSGGAQRFDVIVSEPSNPWVAGVAKLFSREFYEFIPRHLNPGGLMVQWIHVYELSDESVLSILAALDGQFSDYAIYSSNGVDLLLVASVDGVLPPLQDVFSDDPTLRAEAHRVGIHGIADLRARLVADRSIVRAMLRAGRPKANSDYFPMVAHRAPRDRFTGQAANAVATIYAAPGAAITLLGLLPPDVGVTTPTRLATLPLSRRQEGLARIAALAGDPASPTRYQVPHGDLGELEQLRTWGSDCFRRADPATGVWMLVRQFRSTLARTSPIEARPAWVDAPWVTCGPDESLPPVIAQAFEVFANAIDRPSGDALLRSSSALIKGDVLLPAETLLDLYALAMVGAARAGSVDEVNALRTAALEALPLTPMARLQLATIAELALEFVGAAAD